MSAEYRLITGAENPELVRKTAARIGAEWPEFMLHDQTANLLDDCYKKLPDFQFVLTASENDPPVAIGNSTPLLWEDKIENLPDEGWDWALKKGIDDNRRGRRTNIICALQIVVFSENRGRHLSGRAVKAMKLVGSKAGLKGMIAPVRPNRKPEFPRQPIEDYIKRTDDDGRPFDPWLRVHQRLGARIIKPCHKAMYITGTIAEWQAWTGMVFDKSGLYDIPGALVPVAIDIDRDKGIYIEPNVWMYHPPETIQP
ncbi:MAG: hypothetical protein ACOYVF_00805 [Candidatus Zixiibacteriota bacterium]